MPGGSHRLETRNTMENEFISAIRTNTLGRTKASVLAGLVAGPLSLVATTASAGTCPASKIATDSVMSGPAAHRYVTDKVIASIVLAQEAPKLNEHKFRLRHLVIQPGGVVAWHSHAERPAIIYIVSSTIVEHANTCTVPIVHTAGDVARETHVTKH